jgi:demethylmenaquinone methyltransferase/2-methoxy-6-polyprenyl-1,4-benzoquinol methylase
MSAGVHRVWKAVMVDVLSPRPGESIVDLAGGTGDIAFRIMKRVGAASSPITICDINTEMLSVGRDRAVDHGHLAGINWVCGNAEALPFPDMQFDAFTIAFGLRNVTHIDMALSEVRRALKPGGRFVCLEFSKVLVPVLNKIYDTYSFSILPWLGEIIAGDREAYKYLAESIRRFPDQQALAKKMTAAGFSQVKVRSLSGGIAAIHTGWRA